MPAAPRSAGSSVPRAGSSGTEAPRHPLKQNYSFGWAAGLALGSSWRGDNSRVLSYVGGPAAPVAADLGAEGAGSPVGRGCSSSSGCWPASVLPAAATRAVLRSQFFEQGFCNSTKIMTKGLCVLVKPAVISGLSPASQQGDQVGTCRRVSIMLRENLWVPAALLEHISASLREHPNKLRKQECSHYVRHFVHGKLSYLKSTVDIIARIFFLGMAFVLLRIAEAFNATAIFAVRPQGVLSEELCNMLCINTRTALINRILIKRMSYIVHT